MSTRPQDAITIEQRGEITYVTASAELEHLDFSLAGPVATMLVEPIRNTDVPLVVVDLSNVQFFGSVFVGVLLKLWKVIREKNGTMALVGLSEQANELLHLVSLDMLWPIYATRREAAEALLSE